MVKMCWLDRLRLPKVILGNEVEDVLLKKTKNKKNNEYATETNRLVFPVDKKEHGIYIYIYIQFLSII